MKYSMPVPFPSLLDQHVWVPVDLFQFFHEKKNGKTHLTYLALLTGMLALSMLDP